MINAAMRTYNYHTLGAIDNYGQPQLSENVGSIKIAINITSQSIQDNALYKDASYIGLTKADVTDAFVIQYGEERLKVLYVNPLGRYNQVFLKSMA
jgi:hypothetical protein